MNYLPPVSAIWIDVIHNNLKHFNKENDHSMMVLKFDHDKLLSDAERDLVLDYLLENDILEYEYNDQTKLYLTETGFDLLDGKLLFEHLEIEDRPKRKIGLVEPEKEVKKSFSMSQRLFIGIFISIILCAIFFLYNKYRG